MSMFIRKRGQTLELRVKHKRLDAAKYATLDTLEEAEALGTVAHKYAAGFLRMSMYLTILPEAIQHSVFY